MITVTSESARDPVTDHLLTPQNAALVVLDYQPSQVQTVTSMDREQMLDSVEIDRTEINPWENVDVRAAVEAAGRKKLVMTALWTEVCLALAALDAMRDGYEVYPVVDAVGGTSAEAHRAALERMMQAGAKPVSWVQLLCELQRDWV